MSVSLKENKLKKKIKKINGKVYKVLCHQIEYWSIMFLTLFFTFAVHFLYFLPWWRAKRDCGKDVEAATKIVQQTSSHACETFDEVLRRWRVSNIRSKEINSQHILLLK